MTKHKHKCPFPKCQYETDEVEDAFAAILLSVHSTGVHTATPATTTASNAKLKKVRHPTISVAGSSEDWSYFQTRWEDYVTATNIAGQDKVIQLLECCDEQLRRDLTRNTGDSLTNKTANKVMEAIRKLAVQEENTMVTRYTYIISARTGMRQFVVLAPAFVAKQAFANS